MREAWSAASCEGQWSSVAAPDAPVRGGVGCRRASWSLVRTGGLRFRDIGVVARDL
ncbi:MAG: hypothetical protein ACLUJG_01535 [Lawsonibacter sp.]